MENKQIPLKLSTSSRKLLPIVKQKLREQVPPITYNELRRMRMKFHEALILELKETQHLNAHNFFSEIMEQDSEFTNVLTNNNELAELIFSELKNAEFSTKDDEVAILMKLGQTIDDLETPVRWLSGKIYWRALLTIKNFLFEGTRVDAFAKFFYGKYLAEQKNHEVAVNILEESLKICCEVDDWLVTRKAAEPERLNVLVADELYKSMMELSNQKRTEDPETSLELANKAMKLTRTYEIKDNWLKEVICEKEIATCLEAMKEFQRSQKTYEHAYEMSKMNNLHEIGLEVLLKLSECYKSSENFEKFEETLNLAKNHAKSSKTTAEAEGDILVTLGKFYSGNNDHEKALESYNEAVQVFEKFKETKKLQNLRFSMAFLMAEDSFDTITETIYRSDKETPNNNPNIINLRKWQDRKTPFKPVKDAGENAQTFIKKFIDPDEVTKVGFY